MLCDVPAGPRPVPAFSLFCFDSVCRQSRFVSGLRAAFLPISVVAARNTCDAGGGQGRWAPSGEVGNGGGSVENVSQRGSAARRDRLPLQRADLFQMDRGLVEGPEVIARNISNVRRKE